MSGKKMVLPIAVVLALVLVGTYLIQEDDGLVEYDDGVFGYTIQDGKATLVSYHGDRDDLVIPSSVVCDGREVPVRSIGEYVFEDMVFRDIIIPSGCNHVGEGAFMGVTADTVHIPGSLKGVDELTFLNSYVSSFDVSVMNRTCASMDGVLFTDDMSVLLTYNAGSDRTVYEVPEGVTAITFGAFVNAYRIGTLELPSTLEDVGGYSLFCPNLVSVEVSPDNESFTSVDGVLFTEDMTGLVIHPIGAHVTGYTVPEGVEVLGDYSFLRSPMPSVILPSTLMSIGVGAFSYSMLEAVDIPEGVEHIGEDAFLENLILSHVTLPSTLVSLGDHAFEQTSVTRVDLGPSLEHMTSTVFYRCYLNTSFTVHPDNTSFTSVDGVLFTEDMTELLSYPVSRGEGSYTVPEGVETISKGSMACSDIDVLTLPSTLRMIEKNALMESTVSDVVFNEGLVTIGEDAFRACMYLSDPQFPSTLRTIEDGAFDMCSSLVSVDLGENLVYCGSAFNECESLMDMHVPASLEEFPYIYKAVSLEAVYVNDENINYRDVGGILFTIGGDVLVLYPAARPDTTYVVPEGVVEMGPSSFAYAHNLVSVVLPSTLVYVGDLAFENCTALESVTIPDSVVDIGTQAFDDCISLEHVVFGTGLDCIGDLAFNGCDSLTSIVFTGPVVPMMGQDVFNMGDYRSQVTCQVTSQFEEGFLEGSHGEYVTFIYV